MTVARKEVLILDDDSELRKVLRKILEAAGIVVSEAQTISEAVKSIKARMPHLVLLDLSLDQESGIEYLELRAADPMLAQAPVVVFTASKERTVISKAISLGARDYITKPLNSTLILQKVRKALSLDSGFARVEFAHDQRPKVHMVIQGHIVKAGETGFLVEAPLRVIDQHDPLNTVHSDVQVRAPLLDEMGATKSVFRPSSKRPLVSVDAPGQYLTEFSFYGLTDKISARIRRVVGRIK